MAPPVGIEPTTGVSYQVILGHKGLHSVILSVALIWHYSRKFWHYFADVYMTVDRQSKFSKFFFHGLFQIIIFGSQLIVFLKTLIVQHKSLGLSEFKCSFFKTLYLRLI